MFQRIRHRAATPTDLEAVQALLATLRHAQNARCTLHVGDLHWRLCRCDSDALAERLHLWHGPAGDLVGFALFNPPDSCDMVIHPRHRGGPVEQGQLAWAEERARCCCAGSGAAARLTVGSLDGDPQRLALAGLTCRTGRAGEAWTPLHADAAWPVAASWRAGRKVHATIVPPEGSRRRTVNCPPIMRAR
jgi:hypothetical protein